LIRREPTISPLYVDTSATTDGSYKVMAATPLEQANEQHSRETMMWEGGDEADIFFWYLSFVTRD